MSITQISTLILSVKAWVLLKGAFSECVLLRPLNYFVTDVLVTAMAQSNQPFVIANTNGQSASHSTDLTQNPLPPPYYLHERDGTYNGGTLTMSSGSTGIYCDEPPPPYEHIWFKTY